MVTKIIIAYSPENGLESNNRFWKEVEVNKNSGIEGLLRKLPMCKGISECEMHQYGAKSVGDIITEGMFETGQSYKLHLKSNNFTDEHRLYGIVRGLNPPSMPEKCFEMYAK